MGGTIPREESNPMASTVFSLTSSAGANRKVTTQSWQAISRTAQVSQSMIMVAR